MFLAGVILAVFIHFVLGSMAPWIFAFVSFAVTLLIIVLNTIGIAAFVNPTNVQIQAWRLQAVGRLAFEFERVAGSTVD